MKIAIVITGQPRHIEQGAWWLHNHVFPDNSNIEVDIFCYLWDDYNNDPDLVSKVTKLYKPKKVVTDSFDRVLSEFITYIQSENESTYTNWDGVPHYAEEHILFRNSSHEQNGVWWSGYLSTAKATEVFAEDLKEYDLVLKTRSDCIMYPLTDEEWKKMLHSISHNSAISEMIFVEWMYAQGSFPFIGDFWFISKPDVWIKYGTNMMSGLKKLCTQDKFFFYETDYVNIAHWIWTKLSLYTGNTWQDIYKTGPTICSTLLRDDNVVYTNTFHEIEKMFHDKRKANASKINIVN